jgi:hypothetical protein
MINMDKEFVKYEQALALKELGFNEKCIAADYYADGKICIQYTDEGITNTELDEITAQCNEDAVENGENPIDYDPAVPLYSQAFRWFREKHELVVDWNHSQYDNAGSYIGVSIKNIHLEETIVGVYKSYEEAQEACLDKLIQIVKNNAHI